MAIDDNATPQTMYPEDFEFATDEFEAPQIDPNAYVTVLHGYGRRRANERHFLDQYQGRGGVIKDVPRETAEKWATLPGLRVHIVPNDATEMDYAKAAGVRPVAPKKLAALLGASDMDDLVAVLGPEKTQRVIEALQRRLNVAVAQSAAKSAAKRQQAAG